MKFIFSLFFFGIFINATAQTEIDELEREVIKKNRVYKCVKYDYTDSVAFFKKFKNGCYMLFDSNGKRIEKNFYNKFTLKDDISINEEIKVVYLYDAKGRNFMWLWDSDFAVPRISRVRTEKYDSLGNNIAYCESSNGGERCETYKSQTTTDSLMIIKGQKKHSICTGFNEGNRKDTSYTFHRYYTGERIDSMVILNYYGGTIGEKSIQHFIYKSGTLEKTEYISSDEYHILQTSTALYTTSGLLYQVDTNWYDYSSRKSQPVVSKEHWKFSYLYWSKGF